DHDAVDDGGDASAHGEDLEDLRRLRVARHAEGRLEVAPGPSEQQQHHVEDPRPDEEPDRDEDGPEDEVRDEAHPALEERRETPQGAAVTGEPPEAADRQPEDEAVEGGGHESDVPDEDAV